MSSPLRNGIPELNEYQRLLETDKFKEIEKYSNSFVKDSSGILQSYNEKWVKDPLHQWSRQWEYPFVIDAARKQAAKTKNLNALDLGSGITFMPYYLLEVLKARGVTALDYDETLTDLFAKVNKRRKSSAKFLKQDIRTLPAGEQFDFIYCVSVLEHTDQYPSIIKSVHKLLKPGGSFALTFDISLDGYDDIPISEAKKLLKSLEKTFSVSGLTDHLKMDRQKVVVSSAIGRQNKNLLPWKYPVINVVRPLLQLKGVGHPYKNLTFCCLHLTKRK